VLDLTTTAERLADTVLFCHTQFEDQLPNSAGEQKDALCTAICSVTTA